MLFSALIFVYLKFIISVSNETRYSNAANILWKPERQKLMKYCKRML